MKKFLSLLLTAMIILTFTSFPAFAADFSEYLTAEVNPDGVANTTYGDSLIPSSEKYLNGLYYQGVQVRMTEKTGLRFIFARSLELEEAIKAEIPDTTLEVGYLVSLKSTLNNEELDVDNAKVNRKVATIYRTSEELTVDGKETEGYEKFSVCITGLEAKAYLNTVISVRPYMTYIDSQGQSQILYGEQANCSLYMGAKVIHDNTAIESDKEWLNENILSLVEMNDNDADAEDVFMPSTLVFEDNFSGTSINTDVWTRMDGVNRQGKSKWVDDLSYLDGEGNLILEMQWDATNQIVNCGAIISDPNPIWFIRKEGFEYGYGYYEVRANISDDHYGAWFAFWMMVGDVHSESNGSKDGVEIDIIETISNQDKKYNHALHWDGYNDAHKSYDPIRIKNFNVYDGQYHTFGLLRNEEGYTFYIDGEMSAFVSAQNCTPCPEDGHLLLSCEAAEWSGAGTAQSISALPAKIKVDYVRVYEDLPYWIG